MRVALGMDHAGFALRDLALDTIKQAGHEIIDLGTHSTDSVDYPDYAQKVCETVLRDNADRGIVICGSGVGVVVTANKFPGIRAGLCHDVYSASQGVEHDDMNVLALGARIVGPALAGAIINAFLAATYSKEERHQRRLDKLLKIERRYVRPFNQS